MVTTQWRSGDFIKSAFFGCFTLPERRATRAAAENKNIILATGFRLKSSMKSLKCQIASQAQLVLYCRIVIYWRIGLYHIGEIDTEASDRYFQDNNNGNVDKFVPEGIEGMVPL